MKNLKLFDKVTVNARFLNKSTKGVEAKTFDTYTAFNNYLIANRGEMVLLNVVYID